ncbi:MAG: ATP-dependent DNA ligase [Armatimonadota bacterium]|nr:ATP-dependent DNA ligase [Armatimonadota bacterium]MDR7452598.1 ATP-dependent DNA ligase [Armatimonadota bacterium]MDR7468241.1 ATP-dependent DNA ligase [Armatimonadota bacterium]MDR7495235.1 ATP-dependent DNA ligase [Armatimonadota bacterium]MDR7500482.1 ATP-dependent DNA ligase [Armatimonadota bacterium]
MRRLAEVLEAVGRTSSRLQKIDLLAGYLRGLSDDDLRIACTYLTGSPFPAGSSRALNVGWSAIVEALLDVSGGGSEAMDQSYLRHGDLGSVAFELLAHKAAPSLFSAPLTLSAVQTAFERMAAATGAGSRQVRLEGMRSLFKDADPREAKYLVRIITSDLRVGLKEGLLEEAIAKAFAQPPAAVRRAEMLISDIGVVAVMARQNRLAEVSLQLFRPFRFMLAETIFAPEEAFQGRPPAAALIVEDKYDGIRAQVHYDGARLAIFTRTLDEITASFPELHEELRRLAPSYILDGEIVAWQDGRAIPFTRLQQRLRRKDPGALLRSVPVALFVFDLLLLDGVPLLDRPLAERRAEMSRRLRFGDAVRPAAAIQAARPDEVALAFRGARDRGNEGVVIKRPESPYQPGRRGSHWMKLKEELATLDVVVVAAEHGHGKRAGVLSDVTFAVRNGERLTVVGKAYSGLTDEEIRGLTEWFRAHTVSDRGRVKIVEPKIVLEVAFDAVTRSDRHDSGYALRFPRIKRIRDDKTPEEISTLDDVVRIYQAQGASRGGVSPRLGAAGVESVVPSKRGETDA